MTIRYASLIENKSIVFQIDLGSREFLCVSRGVLSDYVAEIYPIGVSWPINGLSEIEAIEESKKLAKTYFQNLLDSVK